MRLPILVLLLVYCAHARSQSAADTIFLKQQPDSIMADTVVFEEADALNQNIQYTQQPGDLTVTRQEFEKNYRKDKFNKDEWKKVVGNTRYEEKKQPEKPMKAPQLAWGPKLLKIIGYIIVFGLLAFLIYLFIKNAIRDPNVKIRKKGATLFSDHTSPEDVEDADIEILLREALAQNNLRLAVRLYYIKLLKHLHREGFIRWEKNKTNRDYADELNANGFSPEFRRLSTAYEYVWYGERTPSMDEFRLLESNFKSLYQTHRS